MSDMNWDSEFDLVVVGTGAAGMTAAVVGATEGLDVLVLEKTEFYGGTTALSGGVAWVPNNPLMLADGIADSPEDALTYLKHNIGNRVAEAKLQAFVTHAPKMVDYMLANTDIEFNLVHGFPDYRPETPGGHQGGRSIDPKVISGKKLGDLFDSLRKPMLGLPAGVVGSVTELRRLAFMRANPKGLLQVWKMFPRNVWNRLSGAKHVAGGTALAAHLRLALHQKNVPLWLNTALEELISEDGEIVGVKATQGDATMHIRARKGVVMAAGGFERNPDMRTQYFGSTGATDATQDPFNDGHWTSGSPGNEGDAIRAGEAMGASTDLMDDLWWMPSTIPPAQAEGESPIPTIVVFERGLPGMIMVNSQGQRFVNEARPYNEVGRVMHEDPHQPSHLIFDQRFRSQYALGVLPPGITPQRYIDNGYIKRAGSLTELAALTGIDAAGLEGTITRFNDMAIEGKDEDFGKGQSAFDLYAGDPSHGPNPCLGPVAKPPFYAIEIKPGDLGTKGGLLMNEHAQVLREDGTVIGGLYAAGNVSASVMGNFYPGAGGTIGPAMTYGYLAAMDAAGK